MIKLKPQIGDPDPVGLRRPLIQRDLSLAGGTPGEPRFAGRRRCVPHAGRSKSEDRPVDHLMTTAYPRSCVPGRNLSWLDLTAQPVPMSASGTSRRKISAVLGPTPLMRCSRWLMSSRVLAVRTSRATEPS